jgi:hypothetical protein
MLEENPKDETIRCQVKGDKLHVIPSEEDKKAGMPAFVFIRK